MQSSDNGMQIGPYLNGPSPNMSSNSVYPSSQIGCVQPQDMKYCQQMSSKDRLFRSIGYIHASLRLDLFIILKY